MQDIVEKYLSGPAVSVKLRPVQPDDETILFTLYASTREEELALVNWDTAAKEIFLRMQFNAQQMHYRSHYPQGDHRIILLDDRPIGRLYRARQDREIRLIDITLLPEYRNRGIGTALMQDLIDEAAQTGDPIRLYVFKYNHAALRLYTRLGFSPIDENGLHIFMERVPT